MDVVNTYQQNEINNTDGRRHQIALEKTQAVLLATQRKIEILPHSQKVTV